jgi:glycosyltransferase involved in cell wall biosynthesis
MPAYSRPARDTLRLPDRTDNLINAPWAVFDADWYRVQYNDAPGGSAEDLLEWHLTRGQTLGYSPNRYFDEAWQRQAWPGILALIEARSTASAFDAWCLGPHATRAPHWLFESSNYRSRYQATTDEALAEGGFINRYDHYLQFGDAEGRSGHPLFEPAVYLAELERAEAEIAAAAPFLHYLRGLENGAPERRTSRLFDPDWYREKYSDAARVVASGRYRSLLEHYLRNDDAAAYDPSPRFSEAYYLAENPGLADAIGPNGFRNGFAHFLAFGRFEGRSPHPELDLEWYAARDDVRADIDAGRAGDAYTHWVTIGQPAGRAGRAPLVINVTEAHAGALYQRRAYTIWPLYGRHKLDFTCPGAPAISVILAMRNHFAETMTSLASAKAHFRGDLELILIDSEPPLPGVDIETHVAGATILRFGTVLNDSAAREAGLICASADVVLLLADGVDLAPGAIGNALARLTSDSAIGAVGGRLIQPHGMLQEAGGIIWRDGSLQTYARNASPDAAEANFVREVDFCSTSFLLARREVLSSLPDQAGGLAGTSHDAADLCVRVQQAGFRVVYEPDAVGFLTTDSIDRRSDGRAAFVAAHAQYLAARPMFDPDAIVSARSPQQAGTRVLFFEDAIPLRRIGSGFVRSNDVLRAMVAAGARVTIFPMKAAQFPLSIIRAELPDTVEVMHDLTLADLADFLSARRDCYDVLWIARTHNLDLIRETLTDYDTTAAVRIGIDGPGSAVSLSEILEPDPIPHVFDEFAAGISVNVPPEIVGTTVGWLNPTIPRIIVDSEAVASVRGAEQAALADRPFDLDAALREEFRNLGAALSVVAVTESEAALIRTCYQGPVKVLGHTVAAAATPRRFEERTGILFVGAIHGMDHPNWDGLVWFIDEVLPLIERSLRWETRLTVAGYTAPGVNLDRFKGHARVTLRGAVADLGPLYDSHRVFVAPARFAAGIPYKVHEAAAFGLPVVATSLLSRQLGWPDMEVIGAADASDPAGFAARVIALHRDAVLWSRLREAALTRVRTELDPAVFVSKVADLLRSPDAAIIPNRGEF